MSASNPAIGHSWEEAEEEVMSFLTPEERTRIDANVKALGELLNARDAGTITREEFDAAFDALEPPVQPRRRPVTRRRARVPKVSF